MKSPTSNNINAQDKPTRHNNKKSVSFSSFAEEVEFESPVRRNSRNICSALFYTSEELEQFKEDAIVQQEKEEARLEALIAQNLSPNDKLKSKLMMERRRDTWSNKIDTIRQRKLELLPNFPSLEL